MKRSVFRGDSKTQDLHAAAVPTVKQRPDILRVRF